MLEEIIAFIRKYNNLEEEVPITGESRLIPDIGLTSFDLLEMCCEMEEEFGVEIDEASMTGIITINDIARCLERNKAEVI